MEIIPQIETEVTDEIIHVGSAEILVKEYKGQRVVTLKDIDMVHERPVGTARRNFNFNRERFIDGSDYFIVGSDEIRSSGLFEISDNDHMDKLLITESGYLMLVKSFTDDKAWEVQRKLVDGYFKVKKTESYPLQQLPPNLQIAQMLINQIAEQQLAISRVETTIENVKQAVIPITDNWRDEINKKFNRIQKNYNTDFRNLRTEMYKELDHRAGTDIHTRLRNMKDRMTEQGSTKTAVNNLNLMDVIEDDKKLREIFSKIVSEYEIRYCA